MNLTTTKINLRRALFSSAALASMLGGIILTASNPAYARPNNFSFIKVQKTPFRSHSIANPNKPDVFYLSEADKKKAERSLDRNNCALFHYGIKCAYGNAGHRYHILKSVRRRHAYAFRGDGRVLSYYIDRVGLDEAILELQRLDIDY